MRQTFAIAALLLAFTVALVSAQTTCESYSTCASCFKASGCGWCVSETKCLAATTTSPYIPKAGVAACRFLKGNSSLWYYDRSQVLSSVTGYPVRPITARVYLKLNEAIDVDITVTAPGGQDASLDLLFVQDTSGSFVDKVKTFASLLSDMLNRVLAIAKDTQFGIASFCDKPISQIGVTDLMTRNGKQVPKNYAYALNQQLAPDGLLVYLALRQLNPEGNLDVPESSFDALGQVLTCDNVGWRESSRKVIVLVTDAYAHEATDGAFANSRAKAGKTVTAANTWNGQCWSEPHLDGDDAVLFTNTELNYPDYKTIGDLFKKLNVVPIFAVAHDDTNPALAALPLGEYTWWEDFRKKYIGFGKTAVMQADSSNIIDIVEAALRDINSKIGLVVSNPTVAQPYLVSLLATTANVATTPSTSTGDIYPVPIYTGVLEGQVRKFTANLLAKAAVPAGTQITFTSPGFGRSIFTLTTDFPCLCCDGSTGCSNAAGNQIDLCNICKGDNSTCIGCDGKYGFKLLDACGVCGGFSADASTCTAGCNPPLVVDKCGVCDGGNQCLGCDSIPNSGSVVDGCGVCNGDGSSCVGCDGLVPTNGVVAKFDICGVCGGNGTSCKACDGLVYALDDPNRPILYGTDCCAGPNDVLGKCVDCNGKIIKDITAPQPVKDRCGVCLLPTDPAFDSCVGCDGIIPTPGQEPKRVDICGICGGSNTQCLDCRGDLCVKNLRPDPITNATTYNCTYLLACGYCVHRDNYTYSASLCIVDIVIPPIIPETVAVPTIIAAVVASVVVFAAVAAAVAGFFIYKSMQDPFWTVPNAIKDGINAGIQDNPGYEPKKTWNSSALAV